MNGITSEFIMPGEATGESKRTTQEAEKAAEAVEGHVAAWLENMKKEFKRRLPSLDEDGTYSKTRSFPYKGDGASSVVAGIVSNRQSVCEAKHELVVLIQSFDKIPHFTFHGAGKEVEVTIAAIPRPKPRTA